MKLRKVISLFVVCLLLTCNIVTAFAENETDSQMGQINATFIVGSEAKGNITFDLFKVGEYNTASKTFKWIDELAEYELSTDVGDSDAMEELTRLVSTYVSTESITPIQTNKTENSGIVDFSELSDGIYLLKGSMSFFADGSRLVPVPVILFLPYLDEDNESSRQVNVEIKYEILPPYVTYTSVQVKKEWVGENEDQPSSVKVALLRNGKEYAEVELNAENEWAYKWTWLDDSYEWSVVEVNVPEHYTASVKQEKNIWTITNTYEAPADTDDPNEDDPGTGDEPQNPPNHDNENPTPPEKIPQTGQLWWLVDVLCIVGLISIVIGMIGASRKAKNQKGPRNDA